MDTIAQFFIETAICTVVFLAAKFAWRRRRGSKPEAPSEYVTFYAIGSEFAYGHDQANKLVRVPSNALEPVRYNDLTRNGTVITKVPSSAMTYLDDGTPEVDEFSKELFAWMRERREG